MTRKELCRTGPSRLLPLVGAALICLTLAPPAGAKEWTAPGRDQRQVQTSGAKLRFGVKTQVPASLLFRTYDGKVLQVNRGANTCIPGVIVERNRGVDDPGRRTLTLPRDGLRSARTAEMFMATTQKFFENTDKVHTVGEAKYSNSDYFKARDVKVAADRPYIAAARQRHYFKRVGQNVRHSALPADQKDRVRVALANLDARTVEGIEHECKIDKTIAANYHPYDSPPDRGVAKLARLAKNGVEKVAFHNTLDYIGRERTIRVNRFSKVKQWDLEVTKNQRLAVRATHVSVSPTKDSENEYRPRYVTLQVKKDVRTPMLSRHAGKYVYRVGDKYYLDGTGSEVKNLKAEHLITKEYSGEVLTTRDLKKGEITRRGIKFNYRNPGSEPSTTADDLSWTGLCHLEGPAAGENVGAKSRVTLYRESTRKAVTLSQHEVNDSYFTLFDNATYLDPVTNRVARVDKTMFAGCRNDSKIGGHNDQVIYRTQDCQRLNFSAKLATIYKKDGTRADQTFLFQEHHVGQRELKKNPRFLRKKDSDWHVIKGDTRVEAEIKHRDFSDGGGKSPIPVERFAKVTLDPSGTERVFIGSRIQRPHGKPQRMTRFYLNPKEKTIESLTWEWKKQGEAYKKVLRNEVQPGDAPTGTGFDGITGRPKFDLVTRGVQGFNLAREVTKESAEPIYQAVAEVIRNRSAAVAETSLGQPVWNFALQKATVRGLMRKKAEPPRTRDTFPTREGGLFSNLYQKLQHVGVNISTYGGPNPSSRVARQLTDKGTHKASEFADVALVDFIWARDSAHAMPMVTKNGRMMQNHDALRRGLNWGREGGPEGRPVYTDAVYKLASDALYLSMVKPELKDVYAIRYKDDTLKYFDNKKDYQAAIRKTPGGRWSLLRDAMNCLTATRR